MVATLVQNSVTSFMLICVIIVFAQVFIRSRFFTQVYERHPSLSTQAVLIVFFGILSIFGSSTGLSVYGAAVNVRDLGPMAAGLICGPYIGLGSGIIGGLFRFSQGGPYLWTGLSAPILSGIIGGIVYLANGRRFVPSWIAVLLTGLSETLISCYTLILVTPPAQFAVVVTTVAIPMILFNMIGMFIFASIVHHTLREIEVKQEFRRLELEVESRKNLNIIINTIPEPVYVLDRDRRFVLVNDSLCRFIGRSCGAILDRAPKDFFSESDVRFHARLAEEVFRTKEPREDETTITKPDGQPCTLISSMALYTDAAGQEFLVGVIRDITDRKKMEQEIADSEKWYRILFEHTGAATIIINEDTTIDQANSEFESLTGYSRAEIEGKMKFGEFALPEYCTLLKEYHQKRLAGTPSIPTSYSLRLKDRSGNVKDVHAVVALIPGTKRSIGSYIDVTERIRAESALRRLNRQLTLLGSATRHDILNKITIVLGFVARLEQKITDPELLHFLSRVKTATKEIQLQTESTRVYQDLGSSEPVWQDLDAIIAALKVPPQVTVKPEVAGIEVLADPMLVKVFENLLDNSVRHGERVTEVRISGSIAPGGLTLVCEDNGTGIPAEEKEVIFTRGYGKNTGLGLFLVREILSMGGMTITETGTEGVGARFEIFVKTGLFRRKG